MALDYRHKEEQVSMCLPQFLQNVNFSGFYFDLWATGWLFLICSVKFALNLLLQFSYYAFKILAA